MENMDLGVLMALPVEMAGLMEAAEVVMVLPGDMALSELFGPVVLVHSHRQAQEIYK
jgi:hypothetical protein